MLNHVYQNWRNFWKNEWFQLFIKFNILVMFLEFVSILVLVILFNEVLTPINHKHCFEKLINWFWYLRDICHITKIDTGFNNWRKLSTLKNDTRIVNEESFAHTDKVIYKKLIIFDVLFTFQMGVSDLTKVLIKSSEIIYFWLILIKNCYRHLKDINIRTDWVFCISLEYC